MYTRGTPISRNEGTVVEIKTRANETNHYFVEKSSGILSKKCTWVIVTYVGGKRQNESHYNEYKLALDDWNEM